MNKGNSYQRSIHDTIDRIHQSCIESLGGIYDAALIPTDSVEARSATNEGVYSKRPCLRIKAHTEQIIEQVKNLQILNSQLRLMFLIQDEAMICGTVLNETEREGDGDGEE
ncbi:hypothetical protein KIPB_008746 [Kipferlia bialata]|uniref:Uncharacterized protein n=1 Tax=Kipferlia bialata TaxID=797122 RepID=A0A9K3D145_9EUKA|nr:hypothetical protein KIPB_008746 [Kipferlia bialata]|eukprot:g8746.t1